MNNQSNRPLSPHWTIHRRFQTAIFSITHRITGFGLNIGTILLVLWLIFLAIGESYFEIIYSLSNTLPIKIILFFWTFGLFFHLVNGIRYLFWSIGYGINMKSLNLSGYLVIVFSLILTILVWAVN